MLSNITSRIDSGLAIDRPQARWLFEHASMATLSELATKMRNRYHPSDEATT